MMVLSTIECKMGRNDNITIREGLQQKNRKKFGILPNPPPAPPPTVPQEGIIFVKFKFFPKCRQASCETQPARKSQQCNSNIYIHIYAIDYR